MDASEKKQILQTLYRYVLSGGTGALINLGLLYALTEYIGLHYLWSATLSFSIALCASFLLQKLFTFRDTVLGKKEVGVQFLRFALLGLFNVALNALFIFLLVDRAYLWYMLAQIISSVLIATFTFFLYKHLIFKNQHQSVDRTQG